MHRIFKSMSLKDIVTKTVRHTQDETLTRLFLKKQDYILRLRMNIE